MSELYIGLISGTSADGIDAALLEVSATEMRVVHGLTVPYPDALRQRVLELANASAISPEDLGQTDAVLGKSFASAALTLLEAAGVKPQEVRAIGSHGQTIRHRPDLQQPFTWQIGDPNQIAARTGIATVADFRRRDMALGGQGAPLVPGFHAAAFGAGQETRVVANIGGIANITVLAAGSASAGFDTGPGNCLLDQYASKALNQRFDDQGSWAASGQPDAALLAQLLSDPYFAAPAPKSSGPEYFNLAWLGSHKRAANLGTAGPDLQATLAELSAQSLAAAVKSHAPDAQLLLLCGGGTQNADLVKRLGRSLPAMQISSTALLGIDPGFVEAAAFAWLAQQALHGRSGNVPPATGASAAAVLGAIYPA